MRGACSFGKSLNGNAFWQSFAANAENPAYPPPGAFAPTSPSRGEVGTCVVRSGEGRCWSYAIAQWSGMIGCRSTARLELLLRPVGHDFDGLGEDVQVLRP